MGVASLERVESNTLLRQWCAPVTGRVLSIGSGGDLDKQGQRYRDYFSGASVYITSDIEGVSGCDLTLDVRALALPNDSFDAVFLSGVLEHVDNIHLAIAECYRVLSPGGTILVGVPFAQPIHRAPLDFWRFTEYGLRWLLRRFVVEDVCAMGPDPKSPLAYWARARKA